MTSQSSLKAAVILAGSGYLDGAEINESVMALLALRLQGWQPLCFAGNKPLYHVVDHLSGDVLPSERRNMLAEAARIARGEIAPLGDVLKDNAIDALVLPGGYGVAKNYSDFALKGAQAQVDPQIQSVLSKAISQNTPILAICISPAVLGLVAHSMGRKLKITCGSLDNDAAKNMLQLGHQVVECGPGELCVDTEARVISTPAFMCETSIDHIWPGIQKSVTQLTEWVRNPHTIHKAHKESVHV